MFAKLFGVKTPNNRKTDRKLYSAAEAGKLTRVSQMIEQGASVDWRDKNDVTALHLAASEGHTTAP